MINPLTLCRNAPRTFGPYLSFSKTLSLISELLLFRGKLTLRLIAVAFLLVTGTTQLRAQLDVPERPENYVLDQGKMFPPEIARRLVDSLKLCAQQNNIHIYVMTVPTLQVMPSRVKEKLEELGTAVTEKWTKGQIGAVIVFDNEAGWVTVGASDEAERVFSAISINMVFRDPLINTRKKHLSPEKLEAAAMVLVNGMTELKLKADQDEKSHRTTRWFIFSVISFTVIIAAFGAFGKKHDGKPKTVSVE